MCIKSSVIPAARLRGSATLANSNPSRIGQINNTGSTDALFLKVFAGEVLTAFKNSTVTMDKHLVRTITSGKSAQFPLTGVAAAAYHTPGQSINDSTLSYLSQIRGGEKTILIDDLLISATFIANIDEAMSHFDVRSIYSNELGTALGLKMDGNVLRKIIQSARISSPYFTGGQVGTVLAKGATVATTASVLAAAIAEAAKVLDEKNVPEADRFAYLRPAQYSLLAQYTQALDVDYSPGGNGSYAEGKVRKIAGVQLVKTNQLPSTNEGSSQAAGDKNGYFANYSTTQCVVATKAAAGTVKLLDLAFEKEYQIERQGTLMVAKYSVGHDYLRPECAVEITSA